MTSEKGSPPLFFEVGVIYWSASGSGRPGRNVNEGKEGGRGRLAEKKSKGELKSAYERTSCPQGESKGSW